MNVSELIKLLQSLPPNSSLYTAGMEGIYKAESGNLLPLKVFETPFGTALYIDDGLADHGHVSDSWENLDEYYERNRIKADPGNL